MTRRRLLVGGSLIMSLLVAIVGFQLWSGPMRSLEETAVMRMFGGLQGRVSVVLNHSFQVLPTNHAPFRAELTPFCSSLVSVLALGAISLFILRGPIVRRLSAFIIAAAFVLLCNVLRVAASLYAGLRYGPSGLVLFHDWVGTIFGLAYTLAGFLLMLYLMLPSATASIPRAARTSDVL